jgi:hypothetical protein
VSDLAEAPINLFGVSRHLSHRLLNPLSEEPLHSADVPTVGAPLRLHDEQPGWPNSNVVDIRLVNELEAIDQAPATTPKPTEIVGGPLLGDDRI